MPEGWSDEDLPEDEWHSEIIPSEEPDSEDDDD